MRAEEVKERSLTMQSHAVAGEIRKAKHELGHCEIRVNTFKEKLAHHLLHSRNSSLSSPELFHSIANLKQSLNLQRQGQIVLQKKLATLTAQYETVRTQTKKITERKERIDLNEAAAREIGKEDALLELQAVVRSVHAGEEKNFFSATTKDVASRTEVNVLSTTNNSPIQDISIPVTRADGVAAQLQVSVIEHGKASATIETQLSSASEREQLHRRMKRALRDQSKRHDLDIEVEVL